MRSLSPIALNPATRIDARETEAGYLVMANRRRLFLSHQYDEFAEFVSTLLHLREKARNAPHAPGQTPRVCRNRLCGCLFFEWPSRSGFCCSRRCAALHQHASLSAVGKRRRSLAIKAGLALWHLPPRHAPARAELMRLIDGRRAAA